MHRKFLLLALLAATMGGANPASAAPTHSKLNALARYTYEQLRGRVPLAALENTPAVVTDGGEMDVFIVGPVSRVELEAVGARVRTSLPGIHTAFLPVEAVERVAALAGVRAIEGASRAEPELNASVPTTNAPFSRGPGPLFSGINGAGVLIGDVDTGIDYGHGDFDKPNGTTRIVNIWDQTVPGAFPAAFGYGGEWNSADIDANVASQTDLDLHGTHVMSIAGGDGSQTGSGVPQFTYAGMAPAADLIMVKTTFNTAQILDGVNYIFQRATALGKNAVVNLSLGSQFGPHDGSSAFEAGLTALTGPGRIVVKSAGNNGGENMHAELMVGSGSTFATLSVTGSSLNRIFGIVGYYESTENLRLRITTPNGTTVGPISLGQSTSQVTTNGTVYIENGLFLTTSGDREVYIQVTATSGTMNGTWTITFLPVTIGPANGEVDMWRFFQSPGLTTHFVTGNQPDEEVISEPGNAFDVITVAAYSTKQFWLDCGGNLVNYFSSAPIGNLTTFSSRGPTRDGRQKPEIAAPGTAIGAARSLDVPMSCPSGPSLLLNDNMNHIINQGTSMSSPHVAGAAALLMQKFGAMTPGDVVNYLANHAGTDANTGTVWNKEWGHGKLRLGDLLDPKVTLIKPNGGEIKIVGQNDTVRWNASDNHTVSQVDLHLSRDGGSTFEVLSLGVSNSGSFAWTVSGPITPNALVRVTAHDPAGNAGQDLSDAVFEITSGVSAPIAGPITDFALSIASRNPTRGPIDIEFALPRAAEVNLGLYDAQGRMVTTLAHGAHEAGRHRAQWDGRKPTARPGIYFVRFKAEDREIVRRIVLMP